LPVISVISDTMLLQFDCCNMFMAMVTDADIGMFSVVGGVIQWLSVWLSVINHWHHSTARSTFLWRQLSDLHRQDSRSNLRWRA